MIVLYPDAERAQVITFDELRAKLIAAYAKHKENEKIKLSRCVVTGEDINFVISYWVSELPALFMKAMDTDSDTITISYSTYPKYFEEEQKFLNKLFVKAAPKFIKILETMNIFPDTTYIDVAYPYFHITVKDVLKFINSTHDVVDIEE